MGTPFNSTPLSNTKPVKYESIFLDEWWLVKPQLQRKGLAVGGVASINGRDTAFFSTVIAKRHEANVLETEDGITIIFRGFINNSRTSQNGFPSEVCSHFLVGFPHDWETYSVRGFGDEYIDGVPRFGDSNTCSQKSADDDCLLSSIRDNDFTKKKDVLLSDNGDLNYCLAPEKLGNSFGNVSKQCESIDNMECGVIKKKTIECECKDRSQPQVEMMCNGENGVSHAAVESQAGNPETAESLIGHLSSECNEEQRIRQKISEDTGNTCSRTRMVGRSIAKTSHAMLKKNKKGKATPVSSPVRRSPRLNPL
ncbi:uncharacterized protein LOC133289443 [Gastrolobium bilobum]|uniref:uncharacterized protein LOC133289443 n=1 Tax=Gastrolobium bilobum TaxID=150636 RepID=UPI002AB0315F|nr:uncharacterized protein LOC133289443 [Gastrolobium bilobum]